jgi:GNAT superfamily N-acetyltransferase
MPMDLRIRRVTESDRYDMMKIARLTWGGYDYIPFVFDEWLVDPNCYTFGVEIDGHLIALNNLRIIDDGHTGWMEGLRVHRDFRKRGLAKALTNNMVEFAASTGVRRVRYTTDTTNHASLRLAEEAGMERKFDMGVFWAPPAQVDSVPKGGPRLVTVGAEELYNLVITNMELIPHSILVFDWKAVDISESALRKVGEKCRLCANVRGGVLKSLSLGLDRKEMKETEWSFTIYAEDNEGFLTHLNHHLSYAKKRSYKGAMGTYPLQFRKALLSSPILPKGSRKRFALTLLEKQFVVSPAPS